MQLEHKSFFYLKIKRKKKHNEKFLAKNALEFFYKLFKYYQTSFCLTNIEYMIIQGSQSPDFVNHYFFKDIIDCDHRRTLL